MQVPAQEPRFKVPRVEQLLSPAGFVFARRPITLGQITSGTTEGKIVHESSATEGSRRNVLDVKRDPRGRLKQSAVFAGASCAGHDKLPVRFGLRHSRLLRRLWFDPNRDRDRARWHAGRFAPGELRQAFRVRDHQLFGLRDKSFQPKTLIAPSSQAWSGGWSR